MPKESLKQKASQFIPYFLLACGIIAFAIIFHQLLNSSQELKKDLNSLLSIMNPILTGLVITFFLTPAVTKVEKLLFQLQDWLRKQERLPLPASYKASQKRHPGLIRFIAMLLCYIAIFGALILALVYIIPQLLDSLTTIVSLISGSVTLLIDSVNNLLKNWDELPLNQYLSAQDIITMLNSQLSTFSTTLQDFIKDLVPKLYDFVFSFASGFINFILGIIISIYLIADRERAVRNIKRFIYAIFKKNHAMNIINISSETVTIFRTFFVGKIIDSLIIGILCYFLMLILRLDYAVLIACIVGITNVIPYFGPYFGAVPSALILMMASPMQSLIFIIMILVLQQFDGNILGPYILGGTLGIKPFWIIFAVTVGGGLFGLLGMIVGVPLFTVFYTLIRRLLILRMEKKNIAGPAALEQLEEERLHYTHPVTSTKKPT